MFAKEEAKLKALTPKQRYIIFSYVLFKVFKSSETNLSQPIFLCDNGLPSSTVKIVFASKMPWFFHELKLFDKNFESG
jgi:hypothetical protein